MYITHDLEQLYNTCSSCTDPYAPYFTLHVCCITANKVQLLLLLLESYEVKFKFKFMFVARCV